MRTDVKTESDLVVEIVEDRAVEIGADREAVVDGREVGTDGLAVLIARDPGTISIGAANRIQLRRSMKH